MSKKVIIDYNTLYHLYVEELLPIIKIAEILNSSYITVKRNIMNYKLVRDDEEFKKRWDDKVSATKLTSEFKEKVEKTNIEKYGVKSVLLLPEVRLK